jgi:hypothetical protein
MYTDTPSHIHTIFLIVTQICNLTVILTHTDVHNIIHIRITHIPTLLTPPLSVFSPQLFDDLKRAVDTCR